MLGAAEADLLGARQWRWLDHVLATSSAEFHIVVSGIQVVSAEHRYEKWSNFPASRRRLLATLARVQGVILISGDRHLGEISLEAEHTHPLYDITASGMTHSFSSFRGEPNSRRVSTVVTDLHFGELTFAWDEAVVRAALIDRAGDEVIVYPIPFARIRPEAP